MFARARTAQVVLLLFVLLALGRTSAQAATWYVGTSGVDEAACGSSAAPCATVNYVLDNKVDVGDAIRVLPGTYTNQGDITLSAPTHRNVMLMGDDPDNRPQLLNTLIFVNKGASGVTISHLRVRGDVAPFDDYVGVINVSDYPTVVDHNEIWNGGQGVMIRTSQQVTVSNNDIHTLGLPDTDFDAMCVLVVNWENDPIPAGGYAQAIRITGNAMHECGGDGLQENSLSEAGIQFNYLIIEHNQIYDNQEQGIDTKGTDDLRIYHNDIHGNGFGGISNNRAYESTERWEIFNNTIHGHIDYAIFDQGGGSSWKVWSNVIYNNVTSPEFSYCAVMLPGDSDTVFYGNTVVNNTDTSGAAQTCGLADMGSGANVINNLFYNNGTGGNDRGNIRNLSGQDGGAPSHNYVYPTGCSDGQCKTGLNFTSTCLQPDNCPSFASLITQDFHLTAGSPAIDVGKPLAAQFVVDLDGAARGQEDGWDAGAYEVQAAAPARSSPVNVMLLR